ncbi:MAG TPA: hypothetical protein DCM86_06025 [Verrucomicrobiales bacterium]|nr:hypothetical protein [Verrucomicrobiales bacterium]
MKPSRQRSLAKTLCIGGALVSAMPLAFAEDASRLEKLEQENGDLKKRLESLEALASKEGLLPSGKPAPKFVSALSSINISGFVQASYFYNSNDPADHKSDGYLWNTSHNSFSINKVKLTLASAPVEASGDTWSAGFKTSLIWGEDSPVLNTGSPTAGFEALREAYVELNAPIGTGLDIKAGQLISLLNWESGDGGAANPNFSQGYQWFFTGNGPSAGVQLGYSFTDWLDLKVRLQNGMYAGPVDGNNGKTVIASLGLKPAKGLWMNFIGWDGAESITTTVKGASTIGGYDFTEKFHTGYEFDYFVFDPNSAPAQTLWSIGGWAWYDFTPKHGIAIRGEYLDDKDGAGLKGIPFRGQAASAITSPDAAGKIESIAVTFNWKPTSNLKVQPEVRFDHTSYTGGFDGKRDRVIFGAGATYMF